MAICATFIESYCVFKFPAPDLRQARVEAYNYNSFFIGRDDDVLWLMSPSVIGGWLYIACVWTKYSLFK